MQIDRTRKMSPETQEKILERGKAKKKGYFTFVFILLIFSSIL